ncbi:MAG: methyltransferase domain-containing protein [Lachnospiraceae bacterium]|jgi:2-polyprenyl-3-methyl-5-hydroxy-6-metoxy-1,4-benzoquinol methylase|nr:methyltransferase domain-containing protein [Lachnospiraceae bacterium]
MNLSKYSLLGMKEEEELLASFPRFPVKMGVTSSEEKTDLFEDLEFYIGKESGLIHLGKTIDPEVLYSDSHYNNVGRTWQMHHEAFAEFISKYSPKSVFEIGGGRGVLSCCYKKHDDIKWTILEAAPEPVEECTAEYEQGIFDENYQFKDSFDAVVHTHTMEHFLKPVEMIKHIGDSMGQGTWMFFSVPNLEEMYKRCYTNVLNFEHTYLCSEPYVSWILAKGGYRVVERRLFMEDHSVFYAARQEGITQNITGYEGLYDNNRNLFSKWLSYHENLSKEINKKIKEAGDNKTVYLFGAHVFAQYLLAFGIDDERIVCVLDNDKMKQGKRLYGTRYEVKSPNVVREDVKPIIILHAGVHTKEIQEQILQINSHAVFI